MLLRRPADDGMRFCTRDAMWIIRLFLYSGVGKNRNTMWGRPGVSRGRPYRQPLNGPFLPEDSRGTEGNDLYRPVSCWYN